jgi:hypothetical protein
MGGRVAGKEKMRNTHKILVRKREGKKNLEDIGVDGRVLLKWILKK